MANLKDLRTKVTVDEATAQFAGHFKTKSSVKNLLRKVGNAKLLAPMVEDEETGVYALGDGEVTDAFMTAIIAGFDNYVSQKAEWDNAGDKHPLPERVEFFRDAVMVELDKTDEIKALIDKGIDSAKHGAHVVSEYLASHEDGDEVRKAILASAIRIAMVAAVSESNDDGHQTARDVVTGEPVDAEVVTPESSASGHPVEENPKKPEAEETPEAPETTEESKKDSDTDKKEVQKVDTDVEKFLRDVCKLLDGDYSNVADAEHVRTGILKSAKSIATQMDEFKMTGPVVGGMVDWAMLMLKSMLPNQYQSKLGAVPVDEAIKLGVRATVAGITERCGDTGLEGAKQDDVSISVMMGAFIMYSMLAAELPEYENIDYALLPILTAAMSDYTTKHDTVSSKTWATLVNLSGIRNLAKYRTAVNKAVECKDNRSAAVRALSGFGHALGATDAERYIKRGVELYLSLVEAA